jgi:AcrR family transcriptional regulator
MESQSAAGFEPDEAPGDADWQRRVVGRSLNDAKRRSIDRGARFIRAAAKVLNRNQGASLTVQEVADEAGQSLRTLYQYFASKDDLLLAVFEEAMRTYARVVREAISELEAPVERLAGGVIASARMLEIHHKAGRDRALAQLRLQLTSAEPGLIARSQAPLTALYSELVGAVAPELSNGIDPDAATYFLASLRTSFTRSMTLGNDIGGELPDAVDLSLFCLSGIGVVRPRSWHEEIDTRLGLVGADGPSILGGLAG